MNRPIYLKEEIYYSDLYDQQTVEECRSVERHFTQAAIGMSEEQGWQRLLVKAALYFVRGERYVGKFDTIALWRQRDRQRDQQLAQARSPCDVRCLTCFSDMPCEDKDLHERDDGTHVLFYFICPKCRARRAFYEDGVEYLRKKVFCTQCQSEAKTEYQRADDEVAIITTCPKCGKVEAESLSLTEETKPLDQNYAADRERFCMSEEEGLDYNRFRLTAEVSKREQTERELRQARQSLFDEISKLKRLTVVELQNLLIPSLEMKQFTRLNLGTPQIKRDVQMSFCVQDARAGRGEHGSIKDLKNAIEEALSTTNWRLMSSGISYRLGILTGFLRGLETERDLLALARMRLKKRTA